MISMALFLLGALVAAVLVKLVSGGGLRFAIGMWALALLGAALIYVGFALRSPTLNMLSLEAVGLIIYGPFVWLARLRSPWYLVAGWLGHIAWDALQPASARVFVPAWYPAACAGFDLVVAIWLAVALRRAKEATIGGLSP
jgi:hypothetical protein